MPERCPCPAVSPDLSCIQKRSFSRPGLSSKKHRGTFPRLFQRSWWWLRVFFLKTATPARVEQRNVCIWGPAWCLQHPPAASPCFHPSLLLGRRASPPPSLSRHPKPRLPAPLPTLMVRGWWVVVVGGHPLCFRGCRSLARSSGACSNAWGSAELQQNLPAGGGGGGAVNLPAPSQRRGPAAGSQRVTLAPPGCGDALFLGFFCMVFASTLHALPPGQRPEPTMRALRCSHVFLAAPGAC